MKKRTPKTKQVKRSLSMIIALALVFSMLLAVPVGATEANASVSADAASDVNNGFPILLTSSSDELTEDEPGSSDVITYNATLDNDQVALQVSLTSNDAGVGGVNFAFSYDTDLFTYDHITGTLLTDDDLNGAVGGEGSEKNPLVVYALPANAITNTGVLFTLYFNVKDGIADGEYAFESANSFVFDSNYNTINLANEFIFVKFGTVADATGIAVSPNELTLAKGKTGSLTATITPEDGAHRFVEWTSSDTSVVSLTSDSNDASVTLYGEKEGTATVTATTSNGLSATCKVTVEELVTSLDISGASSDKDNQALFTGDTSDLPVSITPADSTNSELSWTSSNEDVVTVTPSVDSEDVTENGVLKKTGKVTAMAPGTATVTVSTTDGSDLSVSVTYRVYAKPDETASAASVGGAEYSTVQAAITAATQGDTVTLLRDVYEKEIDVASGLGISLDLAGHTLVTDTFTIEQGASMEKISGGTITQAEYATYDTDHYISQKFKNIGSNAGLSVEGSLNTLEDCQIAGNLSCNDPDGFIDQISKCTLDGYMVISGGQADNIIECQVTGCIAVDSGTTSSDDSSVGVGHIGGLYECDVTGIVFGYNGSTSAYAVDATTLNIFSGSYYNPSDYAVYADPRSLTTLYGGRYGSAKQTGSILDENNVIESHVKYGTGYALSETPDADGYYEVVEGNQRSRVIFSLSPEEAEVTVKDEDGNEVQPEEDNALTYVLQTKKDYTYTVTCDGYETIVGHCMLSGVEDPLTIPVTMEKSQDKNYVTGGDVVLNGGEYYLSDEKQGTVTIMTTEPVTIVGEGIGGDTDTTGRMDEMTLDCTMPGTQLTIRDLWIYDNASGSNSINTINFTGQDNVLTYDGDNLLESQTYVSAAGIHVGKGSALTFRGADDKSMLYMYKYSSGAGIGGNANEACGALTFESGTLLMKGSKTGALIGGDNMTGDADHVNDDIRITGGSMLLCDVAGGSAIGTSRMGQCAGDVYLEGGDLMIVSDYKGAAIGDGGNLYISGGSFKPMRTNNSYTSNGNPDNVPDKVDDSLVTATKLAVDSELASVEEGPAYSDAEMLIFDTTMLPDATEPFTVESSTGYAYTGGLHHYEWKFHGTNTFYTPNDFTYTDDDKNLYIYLPKKDQTLTIDGEEFRVTYSEDTGFSVAPTINGWTVDIADCTYDGTPQTPSVTVTAGDGTALTEGEDYEITWPEDMTSAGEKTLTITPLGKYEGEGDRTVTFTIAPKDVSDLSVTLPDGSFPYTGQAQEPDVTVTMGGTTLVRDTDYTVVYANNTAVGTAMVTVTGEGNYTGTATKTFEITKAEMPTPVIAYDADAETLTADTTGMYRITWGNNSYTTELTAGERFAVPSAWIGQEITIVRVSDDAENYDDSEAVTINIVPSTGVTEPGPVNASGADTLCVRRGQIYYFSYSIHAGEADLVTAYGTASDTVLFGDWDGDGVDTYCVRRGAEYYFRNSLTSGNADEVIVYGRTDDEVLVGDWDGDGTDTLAVRRGRTYYLSNSIKSGNADQEIVYGRETDDVIVGDWDGDNKDTPAVRRGATYYFQNSFTGGSAEYEVVYGHADDVVLVGDWDGDNKDTLAVRRGAEYYFKNSISAGDADEVVVYGRADDEVYAGRWQ